MYKAALQCFSLLICLLGLSTHIEAQDLSITIEWDKSAQGKAQPGAEKLWFEGAYPHSLQPDVPMYGALVPLKGQFESVSLSLRNPRFEQFGGAQLPEELELAQEIELKSELAFIRKKAHVNVQFLPFIEDASGRILRLVEAELVVEGRGVRKRSAAVDFAEHSKLATGQWFRMSIPQDGVYRLNRSYFESLGLDMAQLDPSTINIYGNDAGLLSYVNEEYVTDDLQLKAVEFVGGDDGSFDSEDYILFFAKGPHRWSYDAADDEFMHTKHLYQDEAYCFIGIGVDPPSRIQGQEAPVGSPSMEVTSFDELRFHERDLENVIKSGRRMVGEQFGIDRTLSYTGGIFSIPDIASEMAKVRMRATAKTFGNNISSVEFSVQGEEEFLNLPGSNSIYLVANSREEVAEFVPSSGSFNVVAEFNPGGSDAEGWVDFISINARRQLKAHSSQFTFRDIRSHLEGGLAEFQIADMENGEFVWEVSDPTSPSKVPIDFSGSQASFLADVNTLREYVLFSDNNVLSPSAAIAVDNQDLHGLEQQDMVILTAPPFRGTAEKFAQLHRSEGLEVLVVEPQDVYNEFSSGMIDITAIKMFMKMFYDRAGSDENMMPDYLMMIGDGNYDHTEFTGANSIYIPSYQSLQSNSLTQSYIADDYFSLLDDTESEGGGTMDIGVGRLPVRTVEEAEGIYNKVIRYISTNTGVVGGQCQDGVATPYGDWRNKILLVGDDEDGNVHMSQANALGNIVGNVDEDYIVDKIFLDAYSQSVTPGGDRYPQASDELRRAVEDGVFLVSYTGHGGEVGWAAERVLDVPTIQNFSNSLSMPLMLTATCEFSRFDDPGRTSAGEFTLLNPNGGVIALLTTTRLVYSNPNYILSQNFFDVVLRKDITTYTCDGVGGQVDFQFPHGLRLGDVIRVSKNCSSGNYVNKANFSLLGDPALKLSYPELDVVTDSITDINGNEIDTLKALQRVRFHGHVARDGALASDFTGELSPSVFDKSATVQTLSNDGGNPFTFSLRDNIFYKGRASVEQGKFSFEFIVPRDISYQQGSGKVHYYGLSSTTDANGSSDGFEVGGTDENAVEDQTPPEIELFLDSESFVDGGLTNESPVLIAKIFDETGINTVGNGIGHDVTVVVDGDASNPIVLNDYFELELDSYQRGQVRYELANLEEGEHELVFKVWDIYNNSASTELRFTVEKKEELSLDNVLNYPNPFTTRTEFLFEHNQGCDEVDVRIQVFTVSGKLVKTIHERVDTHEGLRDKLTWDGRDEYGDRLGRGVYVYKLQVRTPEGQKEEVIEKLVLL